MSSNKKYIAIGGAMIALCLAFVGSVSAQDFPQGGDMGGPDGNGANPPRPMMQNGGGPRGEGMGFRQDVQNGQEIGGAQNGQSEQNGQDSEGAPHMRGRFGSSTRAFASSTRGRFGKGGPMGMMGFKGKGVIGSVTSINGTTLTVSGKSASTTVTFTVDASNATVRVGTSTASSTVSSVSVGDNVLILGTVNGTNVTAKTIFDRQNMPMMRGGQRGEDNGQGGPQGHGDQAGGDNNQGGQQNSPKPGFFGRVGGFFKHLFGF